MDCINPIMCPLCEYPKIMTLNTIMFNPFKHMQELDDANSMYYGYKCGDCYFTAHLMHYPNHTNPDNEISIKVIGYSIYSRKHQTITFSSKSILPMHKAANTTFFLVDPNDVSKGSLIIDQYLQIQFPLNKQEMLSRHNKAQKLKNFK